VPFPNATLRTAFDLCAVAVALDPHFANNWRPLFNRIYAAHFPVPQHEALADKRAESHIKRILKNLCWFEHQLLHGDVATHAAASPSDDNDDGPSAAATDGDDEMDEDIVLDQSTASALADLQAQLSHLTRTRPTSAPPAAPAAKRQVRAPWLAEVDRFFDAFTIPKQFTDSNAPRDPLVMWARLRSDFPLLSRVAERVLSVAATSAEAERVFSSAGLIATPDRANLKPETLRMLVFLSRTLRARAADEERRATRVPQ
jgi:hypothetical protein